MKKIVLLLLILLVFLNCKSDDDTITPTTPVEAVIDDKVEVYESTKFEDSYVFAVVNGGSSSYLLNKEGFKLREWNFDASLGNDLELLPDGRLIGMFKTDSPDFNFGGFGGVIRILNNDGTTAWEYTYASANSIAHHDVEMLPNGNVLFIAWERINNIQATLAGVNAAGDIFPETLIELNPTTNQIVWEWHSFDHLIQDQFNTISTFGSVSDNPQLIDFNYFSIENGDIMHANGIDYDPIKDVIYLSVNNYSEVWVIDHSTTIAEAASNSGGNYNKGGDLLYRFGNPEAYSNSQGTRIFYNNHFPNLLKSDEPGAGNVLVYGNGNNIQQSTVFELDIPENFSLTPNTNNEPNIVWSFTDPDLFNGRISGAVRLKNGNTLIAEGDYGIWEVTPEKEVVWKYNNEGLVWRCYGYLKDSEAATNSGL